MTRNQTMIAILLDVLPGLFFQTFGIGHIYAGRVKTGLAILVSYWVLLAVNAALMPFGIGFITGGLTLLAYLVLVPTDLLGTAPKRGMLTG